MGTYPFRAKVRTSGGLLVRQLHIEKLNPNPTPGWCWNELNASTDKVLVQAYQRAKRQS